MIIRIIILIFILINLTGCQDSKNEIIYGNDNGSGKNIKLSVKPDINNSLVLIDDNGNTALKWTDTGLVVSSFLTENNSINVGLSIRGKWFPFGNANSKSQQCTAVNCSQANDIRCNNLPQDTKIVLPDNNQGCYLDNGKGIYMLAAKQMNGIISDPNLNPEVANSPSSADGFYTVHLGDLQPDKNGFITVDKMWECTDNNSLVSCNPIPMSDLVGSALYLKVYDSYYNDNSADFSDSTSSYVYVNIQTGVKYPNFVSETIKIFAKTITSASEVINQSLVASLKNVAFIAIILYIGITGLLFMIGLSQITQKEAVIRLFKISIVLMFLTPNNTISENFPKIYLGLANISANIIMNNINASGVVTDKDNSINELEKSLNYLTFYDNILNQIMSRQVNYKILSLHFTKFFILGVFMYVLLVILVLIILKSMLIYIAAYAQIAILVVILPIIVPTILFETTSSLFQDWLKFIANSALMIVIATIGLSLVFSIMINDLNSLLNFDIKTIFWGLIWVPVNEDQVSQVLSYTSYMLCFFKAIICYEFVSTIPKLADALSASQLSPSTNTFKKLLQGIQGLTSPLTSRLTSRLKYLNNRYLIGRVWDKFQYNNSYEKNKNFITRTRVEEYNKKITNLKEDIKKKIIDNLYVDEAEHKELKNKLETLEGLGNNLKYDWKKWKK